MPNQNQLLFQNDLFKMDQSDDPVQCEETGIML